MKRFRKLVASPVWAAFFVLVYAAGGLAIAGSWIDGEPNPLED